MSDTTSDSAKSAEANEKFESGKVHVKQAADDLRSAAGAKAQDIRERAGHAYDNARTRARSWQEEGEQYVRTNPLRGVLTAVGVGFILGLLIRR